MTTTSKEVGNLVKGRVIPKWVASFLKKTVFEKCPSHDMQKNELNKYCTTCDLSACKHCITRDGHKDHQILNIYRHVYQNVVPQSQMQTHIDREKIQPYKCNKKWVLSLTPLPHKGSGLLIEGDGACSVCNRKLYNPERIQFCSIMCKLREQQGVGTSRSRDAGDQQPENPSKRKRSRKGVLYRAPLF